MRPEDLFRLGRTWNVKTLPHFVVFSGGEIVNAFTCNLSTINRLRTSLQDARLLHAACAP